MDAAIAAARRGHQVTLFEKQNRLGGQLQHSDYLPGKWNLKAFKDYLIRELSLSGVEIRLGTEATPELLENYDAVVAAPGSVGKRLDVPGGDQDFIWQPTDVFGNADKLGAHVVVCGGGSIGMDVALYLASSGHRVTVLTRQKNVGFGADSHDKSDLVAERKPENPAIIREAQVTEIFADAVVYTDRDGTAHNIPFDSIVVSAGRMPLLEECERFAVSGLEFYVAGDCSCSTNPTNGKMGADRHRVMPASYDVQNATFTGYTAGMRI